MTRRPRRFMGVLAICLWAFVPRSAWGAEIIYSSADGTLADGGVFGPFDGLADKACWPFGPEGIPGAVTLARETAASAVEHRVVFEYDLRGVV